MNKLLVITGPTATGKTALGLELAKEFNGEIISADSRQVYKHMDIGTGKDLDKLKVKSQRSKVQFKNKNFSTNYYYSVDTNIWGLDIVEPGYVFNPSDYVNYAKVVLEDIWSRGKLPIIVGGTGQYIKELLNPSDTLHIPPNEELRNKLLSYSLTELQQELQNADKNKWELMNESDRSNPRRLVRAIEVAGQKTESRGQKVDIDFLIIGLTAPLEFLYKRIDKRVEERLKMGMEEERKKLAGYKIPRTLGYNGESVQEWKFAEHAYARRQLTYQEKQIPGIKWFDISKKDSPRLTMDIRGYVAKWCGIRTSR